MKPNLTRPYIFLADYEDKQGQSYNRAFCGFCSGGNYMQIAAAIRDTLEKAGYTVTTIFFIPGKWTPQ